MQRPPNIFIEPIALSSLHKFYFLTNLYIPPWLWNSTNKWKVDLQVKKLKVDISANPRKNSVTGPYHHPQGRDKLLIPPVKGED